MSGRISTIEAAKRCGVTARTVARWVDAGVLPAVFTTGGHRRILEEDLLRFMETRRSLKALDQTQPSLRVVVLSPHSGLAQRIANIARRHDPNVKVSFTGTGLEAAFRIGHELPHLVVVDETLADDYTQFLRELSAAKIVSHAFVVSVQEQGAQTEYRHLVLTSPVDEAAIRHLLRAAENHRRG